MATKWRTIASALVIFLSGSFALAQVAPSAYPFGTFDTKGIDTINVGNLNLHLSIPIIQKAGRGVPFSYALTYDSSVWQVVSVSGTATWTPVQGWGWLAQTVVPTGYITYSMHTYVCDLPPPQHGSFWIYDTWVYHDPMGASHPFSGDIEYDPQSCDTTTSSFTATANDGSGITLYAGTTNGRPSITQKIVTRTGQVTTAPVNNTAVGSTITDTNGNQVSVSASGVFTDTTGVNVLTVTGQAPNPVTLTYPTVNGTASYTMKYGAYTVQTGFGCGSVTEYSSTNVPLINEIDLPDSSKYTFVYETTSNNPNAVTGRLASVTLPSGGTIQYSYTGGSHGIVCADGSTSGVTRTLSNDPAGSTWTYARAPGTGTSHTDVTDGLGNQSKYDFVETGTQAAQYYETNRSVYQGPATGTPVVSRQTCYNGAAAPCTTSPISYPVTQIDTYETLDGIQTHGGTTKYNSYGLETERDDYDFHASPSRGSLLRKEVWTYGAGIVGLVSEDDVYDGSGSLAGKTTYIYDIGTLTASSGVPQHVAVSGARGNLTQMTQYASSGTSYTTNATYEDTGSILTSVAPTGTTTFSYDSTYAYPTAASLPTPSSGIGISTGASYDTTSSGLPLTSTDPNSQVTRFTAYDSMLRPTETDFPDGGKTTSSYLPTQVSQQLYQSSSVFSDTETQLDGYGRASRIAVANGQSGNSWNQKDICYDANGNASFSSYAYQGTGLGAAKVCSGAGDSYTYDVVGRLKTVTRANGESRSYTYTGRATQVIDENGVTRISQVDGLGRLTTVCEISSMPGKGACGTDISGTGFVTNYSYTLATHTTTVTQGVGVQTRTFQTDWLDRTTSVTEPESGTTTYGYVYNSTGLQVTRSRPKANQTNPSVLTTTTTQYDSVGRVVTISYSDGTPTKTFTYDKGAGANFTDLAQVNLKGRLSLASVSGAGTAFSYDATGRPSYLDECLPSGCGTVGYNRQLHYVYDLAGNVTSSTDGGGVTSTYALSPANEILSLTSSLNNATDPANLVSNVLNGPNGPIFYNLGNGLSGGYSYDGLGRLNGAWVRQGGNPTSCPSIGKGYKFTSSWKGDRLTNSSDTVLGQTSAYGYDEFDRLTSRTVTTGTAQNFAWVYDRWGNRTQQNVTAGSGPSPQYSFNTSTNQITNSGYAYDAAGNMTNDGFHSYTYDAEGNITAVDGGSTAQYVYNALNQRVRTVVGSATTEFVFNASGQRVSEWNGTTHAELKGHYYWQGRPVAYYAGGAAHFQHQDWLGTERIRTSYNGTVEGTFISLPFGDSQTTASGSDGDQYHYAQLDYDSETTTSHAQFRQYSSTQGRWMRPDPYSGSYDLSNPQSFNRYAYANDNPTSMVDPSGLDGSPCGGDGAKSDALIGHPRAMDDCYDGGSAAGSGGGSGGGNTYDPCGGDYDHCVVVDGGDPNACDMSNPICQMLYGHNSPGASSGARGRAPNNGSRKYHCDLMGNCYKGPEIPSCFTQAVRKNGLAFTADALGSIPGEGQVVAGVQIVAAGVSYVNGLVTNDAPGSVGGVLAGQAALVGVASEELGVTALKTVPVLGNLLSAGLTVRDILNGISDYQACVAGH
jgi:RHS repeat-associated protein